MKPNKKEEKTERKKAYHVNFYPSVKDAGKAKADKAGLSFNAYLEALILDDLANE